jgi:hypothetical protein
VTDFFAPDTTYTLADPYKAPEIRPQFQCVAVAVHPSKGEDRAFGFWRAGHASPWVSHAADAKDWAKGWVEMFRPEEPTVLDYDDGLSGFGSTA